MLWDNDGSGYGELKKEREQNKPELAKAPSKTGLKPYITNKNNYRYKYTNYICNKVYNRNYL